MMNNNNNNSNNNDYDFETGVNKKASIRVSALPQYIRASAEKIATEDGDIGISEVATVLSDVDRKTRTNTLLRRLIAGFAICSILLVAGVFGASITAARLSQDIAVDHTSGFAYVKGSNSEVMKTAEAINYSESDSIGLMSNTALSRLREIILADGDIRFSVKGHARNANDDVILLVEGGTITFNDEGIVDVRGDAKFILEAVYGLPEVDSGGGRGLGTPVTCEIGTAVIGSSGTNYYFGTDVTGSIGTNTFFNGIFGN